ADLPVPVGRGLRRGRPAVPPGRLRRGRLGEAPGLDRPFARPLLGVDQEGLAADGVDQARTVLRPPGADLRGPHLVANEGGEGGGAIVVGARALSPRGGAQDEEDGGGAERRHRTLLAPYTPGGITLYTKTSLVGGTGGGEIRFRCS